MNSEQSLYMACYKLKRIIEGVFDVSPDEEYSA